MSNLPGLVLSLRVKVARSHALWVVGALGQAYFGGLVPLQRFDALVKRLRIAYNTADTDEASYDQLLIETATVEEVIAEASYGKG